MSICLSKNLSLWLRWQVQQDLYEMLMTSCIFLFLEWGLSRKINFSVGLYTDMISWKWWNRLKLASLMIVQPSAEGWELSDHPSWTLVAISSSMAQRFDLKLFYPFSVFAAVWLHLVCWNTAGLFRQRRRQVVHAVLPCYRLAVCCSSGPTDRSEFNNV
jgi:hypothetical protein